MNDAKRPMKRKKFVLGSYGPGTGAHFRNSTVTEFLKPSAVPADVTASGSNETKRCAYCAEEIRLEAIKCKHCGEFLNSPNSAGCPANSRSADIDVLVAVLFETARKDSSLRIIPTIERELVVRAQAETQGNQVQASKLLGITRATLRKRVTKFNIVSVQAVTK